MYLFARRARLSGHNLRDAMAWAAGRVRVSKPATERDGTERRARAPIRALGGPGGLGLVGASRYLVACVGDGPASAMTSWIRKTAEGDKEEDGGRRHRID